VRLISWNVASLRARLPRVLELLAELEPDALCLQETKCAEAQLPRGPIAEAGYRIDDHSGGPWNGVAVLTRIDAAEPGDGDPATQASGHTVRGLPGEPDPTQARWVETRVAGTVVVSVYVPNGKALDHPDYQAKLQFFREMADRVRVLADAGPVAVLGDVNVCPTDQDVWNVARFEGHTHTSEPERAALRAVLEAGPLVDAHDRYNGALDLAGEPVFTWWDYRAGSFHKNQGLRIDLAMLDTATAERIDSVWIARDYRKGSKPSDHVPLVVDLHPAA
jgi:exodeoxyribonuclease-3